MVKVCSKCEATFAGGVRCLDCGGKLIDPFQDEMQSMPDDVWRFIRALYAARRGMLVRLVGILLAPVAAYFAFREVVVFPEPWNGFSMLAALTAGIGTYGIFELAANRAYKVWMVPRGRLRYLLYARAMALRAIRWLKDPLGRRRQATEPRPS